MQHLISDFVPAAAEAGVGLALQDTSGRYLFFLAGKRHHCPPGELFYAGIGGHHDASESWVQCAQREAREEIGTNIEVLHSPRNWLVSITGDIQEIVLDDKPAPLAIYEMIHPENTPRAGGRYRILIFLARLKGIPENLPVDEVQGVIAMTREQVIRGIDRRIKIRDLLEEGAAVVAADELLDPETILYPIGTAAALALLWKYYLPL